MIDRLWYIIILLGFLWGCEEEPPVGIDGNAGLEIHALWDSDLSDSLDIYEPLKFAKVFLISEYGTKISQTDENGIFVSKSLPCSRYSISVRMVHPLDPNIVIVGNIKDLDLNISDNLCDTIIARQVSSSGISINEIYSVGPVNNFFFFYDLFIELYNSSDEVKYLDGLTISRMSGNSEGMGPGADEDDDGDIDGVTYFFKFPGNPGEKNYPFEPRKFLVLAGDAVNHKNTLENAVDLSKADWEFYNQFSPEDIDNPNVPNLINLRSDRTVDFLIGLTGDVIVLTDGRDTVWNDGLDISTVLDGVEYQSGPSLKKTLDSRVDRGYALCPQKYSDKSMQRHEPGSDSNDATLDWEIIPFPTPGYHK
jgi:signal peptidase I